MKPVLMENAIRFCDDIKDGKVTLQYQKNFVSSLHNAVELIMKQMLLNDNDHRVAEIRKVKNEADAKLLLDYFKATDLNSFFDTLSNENLSKFNTIQFNELQKLRNSETHFLIRQGSFLSEEDFCVLHNFMIRFYKIMETWCPIDKDDYELYILPYWGDPIGADSIYGFNREPLQSFSYETAVKNSKLAKKIAELLNGDYLYGAPDFSPYTITKDLIEQHMELSSQFDEIWSMVYMMQCLEMISVDEILDDEQGRVYFATSVGISL